MAEQFIQRAIKHPGSLRAFAKKHRALTARGTVNLPKARRVAKRLSEPARAHRLRQINLAENLKRLRA